MNKKAGTYRLLPFWLHVFSNAPVIYRMMKVCVCGAYRVPHRSLLKIAVGITYVFFFIDFIPDFIPVAGWLDDLAVSAWVIHSLGKDLVHFRNWEKGE